MCASQKVRTLTFETFQYRSKVNMIAVEHVKKQELFFTFYYQGVGQCCALAAAKGQLISKANFLVLIRTKKRTKLFFDFCPKDLKQVKSKNKCVYYVKYPLINIIKCLHFFDLTHFQRLGQKSKNSSVVFFGSNENKKIFFRN